MLQRRVLRGVLCVLVVAAAGASGLPWEFPAARAASRLRGGSQQAVQSLPPTPEPAAAGTGSIAGQVVAADNGTPIRRTRVTLIGVLRQPVPRPSAAGAPQGAVTPVVSTISPQQGAPPMNSSTGGPSRVPREAESDSGGRFEFRDLPAGDYIVAAMPASGFVAPRSVDPVRVDDGKTATVTIRLGRAGAITGRVLDNEGEPVVHAMVRAVTWESMGGVRRLSQRSGASTNDLGEFRLFNLPSGDYYVGATVPNYRSSPGVPGPKTGFVSTYYPNVPTLTEATPVTVRPGIDAGGIEVHLLTAPLATITGTIANADGQPLSPAVRTNLMLSSRADEQSVPTGSGVRPDGTFTLTGIGPGDYYLIASANPATSTPGPVVTRPGTFTTVSVDGSDLTVNLELNNGATISGYVRVEGKKEAATPARWSSGLQSTRISVRQVPFGPLAMVATPGVRPTVAEDGSFTLSGLRGLVMFNAFGPGVLQAVMFGGREITGTPMELAGNERLDGLELVLTTEVGGIEGRVVDGSGQPVRRAYVVVFPDDPARLFPGSPFIRTAGTVGMVDRSTVPSTARVSPAAPAAASGPRAPGDYVVSTLVPGRYRLVAFDAPSGPTMPPDVEMLRALSPKSTAVTVKGGTTAKVELRLTPDPTQPGTARTPVTW